MGLFYKFFFMHFPHINKWPDKPFFNGRIARGKLDILACKTEGCRKAAGGGGTCVAGTRASRPRTRGLSSGLSKVPGPWHHNDNDCKSFVGLFVLTNSPQLISYKTKNGSNGLNKCTPHIYIHPAPRNVTLFANKGLGGCHPSKMGWASRPGTSVL